MNWIKLQHIFSPNKNYDWMQSHASNPFAVWQRDGIFRIYFTCRDSESRSHIGYVDVDFNNKFNILEISNKPVIAPGELGMFDDSGVAMGYYIVINQIPHIYYLGWNLKVTVPWLNTIGLAKQNSLTGKFEKVSRAPIMDRSNEDPFSISYPSILFEDGIYKMWYGSNLKWGKLQHEMNHVIKYAESTDGLNWIRTNQIAINNTHEGEYALSKPFVIKEDGKYIMWYSYRANKNITTYRIGYAISDDGINWERKDENVGLNVSESDWDSEMICYPSILTHENKKYMLYNGNGYGKTGFGIAVLKK
jgi:predicted GH43/DUF377 family glycosyl hydrolase